MFEQAIKLIGARANHLHWRIRAIAIHTRGCFNTREERRLARRSKRFGQQWCSQRGLATRARLPCIVERARKDKNRDGRKQVKGCIARRGKVFRCIWICGIRVRWRRVCTDEPNHPENLHERRCRCSDRRGKHKDHEWANFGDNGRLDRARARAGRLVNECQVMPQLVMVQGCTGVTS